MVQAVQRAVRLLEALGNGSASLKELSDATGLNRTTVFRLLETLTREQLVEQQPDKRYRLGLLTILLGQAALNQRSTVTVALPHMEDLVRRLQESVSLILYGENEAFYVQSVESDRSMRARPQRPGAKIPLHCSASGKVYLASLPVNDLKAMVKRLPLERRTPHTITEPARLLKEIDQVRRQGYAVDDQELETGLICVAAPLRDFTGRVLGAVSVSGHCVRIEAFGLDNVIREVRRKAEQISLDLGMPASRQDAAALPGTPEEEMR